MTRIACLTDIEVYKESLLLIREVFELCKNPLLRKEYSLCDQIKRAAISIAANIAEGYGRKTKADFAHFLSISFGSVNEVIALLDVINITHPNINTNLLRDKFVILSKRIFAFRRVVTSGS
jgi:four helix bundle protein